tara:strand:+ start:137 stop:439 length:303 start_codon:yes stop_codon:yes gene_type:complete
MPAKQIKETSVPKSANTITKADNNVKIIMYKRGRRITDEDFNALSENEKKRVLRNRRTAKETRARRKKKIKTLENENALLEASIKLKKIQVDVLSSLLNA